LWSVTAELTGVLDLTAMTTLSAVAIDPTDLVRPDHAFTQQLGEAAHERGIQAIKSPSVTGVDEILAIFPENLGAVAVEVELVRLWSSIDDV
ncbi:MAG: RES family NAD+ phosphorylase, partial [Actinomycetota bacterium]|nr:RES family NAD+ phosphorylase [Actinomycetota bacterium]